MNGRDLFLAPQTAWRNTTRRFHSGGSQDHGIGRIQGVKHFHPARVVVALAAAMMFLEPSAKASEGLPTPLRSENGDAITGADGWTSMRRAQVLALFRQNIYGKAPVGRPENLQFHIEDSADTVMEGAAQRKLVRITYSGPGGEGAIRLVLFTPTKRNRPAPCFLLICNRGPDNIDATRSIRSPFWPAEAIVANGFAAAAFLNTDVAPDTKDAWQKGVHKIYDGEQGRTAESWGTIAAWAWGASRVMDYLVTDPAIDAKRVAVVGHSRGGKTALWAAAEDERFAMAVSNDSGSTGAAMARGKTGERIKDINRGFPHWFCENYKTFNDRETALPVDQHMLLSLIAPRPLYVASASEDSWADPRSEFQSAVLATQVYELLGKRGISQKTFPEPEKPLHEGAIGYHVRTGKHNLTEYDWAQFMAFAKRHGWTADAKP